MTPRTCRLPARLLLAAAFGTATLLSAFVAVPASPAGASRSQVASGEVISELAYSADGGVTWTADLTVAPGATVLVQHSFFNPTAQPVEDASIRGVLPAGFVLVPGSTRGCALVAQIECDPAEDELVWTGPNLQVGPNGPSSTTGTVLTNWFGFVEYRITAPTVDGTFVQHAELVGTQAGQPLVLGSQATLTVAAAGVPMVDPLIGGALLAGMASIGGVVLWGQSRRRRMAD
jgi:hypothetical protein